MRIPDGYGKLTSTPLETTRKGGAAAPTGKADTAADEAQMSTGSAEKVTVSDGARQAAAQAESQKIDKLRASIQDGSFKVDTHAIAAKIVEGG